MNTEIYSVGKCLGFMSSVFLSLVVNFQAFYKSGKGYMSRRYFLQKVPSLNQKLNCTPREQQAEDHHRGWLLHDVYIPGGNRLDIGT